MGGADNNAGVSLAKKKEEGLTQVMVDKKILVGLGGWASGLGVLVRLILVMF